MIRTEDLVILWHMQRSGKTRPENPHTLEDIRMVALTAEIYRKDDFVSVEQTGGALAEVLLTYEILNDRVLTWEALIEMAMQQLQHDIDEANCTGAFSDRSIDKMDADLKAMRRNLWPKDVPNG